MGYKKVKYTYVDETITADYILNLYDQGKRIENRKDKKEFLQGVKKLIPYIGQSITLQVEE
tara:strand:+ start:708 stop:890 length:183 start_codon:yes stop_codon:yes gene_type:complete